MRGEADGVIGAVEVEAVGDAGVEVDAAVGDEVDGGGVGVCVAAVADDAELAADNGVGGDGDIIRAESEPYGDATGSEELDGEAFGGGGTGGFEDDVGAEAGGHVADDGNGILAVDEDGAGGAEIAGEGETVFEEVAGDDGGDAGDAGAGDGE